MSVFAWLLGDLVAAVNKLTAEVSRLRREVKRLAFVQRRPMVRFFLVDEVDGMALVYAVSAGAPVDKDVAVRELSVTVDGVKSPVATFAGDATDLGDLRVEKGAAVVATLVDVDDAGNRSQPAVVEFVAVDTIPPATPSGFAITLVRED